MEQHSVTSRWPAAAHTDSRNFRRILHALSRPGTVVTLESAGAAALSAGVLAIARCLIDLDSAVWLDPAFDLPAIRQQLILDCGAILAPDTGRAAFALIGAPLAMPPLEAFAQGEAEYPERSSTLVIEADNLIDGPGIHLAGPGIERTATIAPTGLPDWFWPAWDRNTRQFPLGVDIYLVSGSQIVGLPRTSRRS